MQNNSSLTFVRKPCHTFGIDIYKNRYIYIYDLHALRSLDTSDISGIDAAFSVLVLIFFVLPMVNVHLHFPRFLLHLAPQDHSFLQHHLFLLLMIFVFLLNQDYNYHFQHLTNLKIFFQLVLILLLILHFLLKFDVYNHLGQLFLLRVFFLVEEIDMTSVC